MSSDNKISVETYEIKKNKKKIKKIKKNKKKIKIIKKNKKKI